MKELSLQNCRIDGRYDVQMSLGHGSYAEIYVARDILASPQSPHNLIVIKALNVFLQDDLDTELERTLVENFQNEAVALDRVRHPNIISRLGHGTARDLRGTVFHYLVLEYLPGGDLAKLRQKQKLSLPLTLNYLEQTCAGLAHAHKNGIIHRDIKPQNLLLTKNLKTVKIADFGVAKISQSDAPITRVGTNMYAPPEHSPYFSEGMDVVTITELTPAADVYSLAKSAYVLITGESPRRFTSLPINDLPLSSSDKNWSGDLLRVLRKATQNNPAARYQTVTEFWQELARIKFTVETEEPEFETQIATRPHLVPQASVSKDFSPQAPLLPKFNTSRELKGLDSLIEENDARLVVKVETADNVPAPREPSQIIDPEPPPIPAPPVKRKRKNTFLRRASIFLLLLGVFAVALFATQNYLRNGRILPKTLNPFAGPQGIASSNVNLRLSNDANSQKIGLVPKGSRVRIVNVKDDWMEIDIIEFSREKENPTDAEHGWVNRKYIDVQEN